VLVAPSTLRSSALCTNMSWGPWEAPLDVVPHAAIDDAAAARNNAVPRFEHFLSPRSPLKSLTS
jgi:hypothetical protein